MAYGYPYGNGQQLNLDWFLEEWKNLLAAWEAEKNGIDGALQAEIDRAEAALADVFAARDAAAQSAENADASERAAAQSAQDASGYLATVRADANTARNAAQNAAQSESNAADSAQTALASKNNAADSASAAAQSAQNANASKNAAAQSAEDAQTAEQNVQNTIESATAQAVATATQSANDAANRAGNSASAAAQSASDADASKRAAAQSATRAEEVEESIPQDYIDLSNDVDGLKTAGIINTIQNAQAAIFKDGAALKPEQFIIEIMSSGAGWTGAKITKAGFNLFNKNAVSAGWLTTDGNIDASQTSFATSDFIPVLPGIQYYISQSNSARCKYYDANKNPITNVFDGNISGTAGQIITIPSGVYYMRKTVVREGSTETINTFCFNVSDSTKNGNYEPYNGEIINVAFPTEAGTVTNGELDVINKKLIVGTSEYNLTIPDFTTLAGNNYIIADTGNIKNLQYYANNKFYVNEENTNVKALIAPILSEMKADSALTINDFRIVDNTLYRITTPISTGATLIPNTNCRATTIADVLKSLLS